MKLVMLLCEALLNFYPSCPASGCLGDTHHRNHRPRSWVLHMPLLQLPPAPSAAWAGWYLPSALLQPGGQLPISHTAQVAWLLSATCSTHLHCRKPSSLLCCMCSSGTPAPSKPLGQEQPRGQEVVEKSGS